jgi:hypothetical protein
MGQTSDCGIQRTTPQLGGLALGCSLQRLQFVLWADHVRSAVETEILEQASFEFFRPAPLSSPAPAVIPPMIQVISSFNKMINGTNKFRRSRRFSLPRDEQEKILQRTLHMCQECAFLSHVRTVVQGICSAFGSTDRSIGTDNYLKREEYSDYKQVLPTSMILLRADDVVCQKAHTLNAVNNRYLAVCCHMLWQIITQSTWCCSLFLKSSHKQRFHYTGGSFKVLNFSAMQEIPLFSWTRTRIMDFTEVPNFIQSSSWLNLVHNLAFFIFVPTLIVSFRFGNVWLF